MLYGHGVVLKRGMEVRLRQVARVAGLREETEIGEPERPDHLGPSLYERKVRLSSKVGIDEEKSEA